MRRRAEFVQGQRKAAGRFCKILPVIVTLMAGLHIWNDIPGSQPLDRANVTYSSAIMLWAGVVYLVCQLGFKVVLASVFGEKVRS